MNRLRFTPRRFGVSVSAAALIASVFILIGAVQIPRPHISSVTDWTHHHLLYSQPSTWVSAWKMQQEPRFWQQKIRRGEMNEASEARHFERFDGISDSVGSGADWARDPFRFHGPTPPGWHEHMREIPMERDWGTSLGAGGSTGVPVSGTTWFPVYPAKFSFDTTAAPDCTKDYVVFPTNLSGVKTGQASIIAYNKLYSGTPALTAFCGAANPAVYWSYNTNFNAAGGATTGTIATSPVLSLDGSKVAFIENNGGAGAILHVLKWKAGDGGAINTAINPTVATSWTACPANACMISITFANADVDDGSSPFYDYAHDALYVGDNLSVLHKFINVFGVAGATPSEVTTGGWPFTIDTAITPNPALTSPVLDGTSGNIFVGDANGTLTYVRETFSTAGTCKTGAPPCIGSTTVLAGQPHSIIDAPIVDSSTQKVFVFYGNYDSTNTAVVQSDTTLSAKVAAFTGSKAIQRHMHSGAFDNTYLTGTLTNGRLYLCGSSATSLPTLQRIGFNNTATTFANKTGTMNTTVDAVTLQIASAAVDCSPLTEFFNTNATTNQDQIFFGVATNGAGAACSATVGCVMAVNITGTPGALTINSSIAEITGPSGIIVDNNANTTPLTGFPQASSLYFSSQGNSTAALPCGGTGGANNVGCAVKVTQSGLQ